MSQPYPAAQSSAFGRNQSAADQYPDESRSQSETEALTSRLVSVNEITLRTINRVEEALDRLLGASPTKPAETGSVQPVPNGHLAALAQGLNWSEKNSNRLAILADRLSKAV